MKATKKDDFNKFIAALVCLSVIGLIVVPLIVTSKFTRIGKYNTTPPKFYAGQLVKFTDPFFRNCEGVVQDYTTYRYTENPNPQPTYKVKYGCNVNSFFASPPKEADFEERDLKPDGE